MQRTLFLTPVSNHMSMLKTSAKYTPKIIASVSGDFIITDVVL